MENWLVFLMNSLAVAKPKADAAFDSRIFKGFKPETENPERKAMVKENKALKLLLQAWKEYCKTDEQKRFERYYEASRCLHGIKFSSEDVSRFCLSFSDECDHRKLSMFLNALIEKCADNTVTIHVSHIGELSDIGYYTTKNIIIYGNVGSDLGRHKYEGSIILYGNAGFGVLNDTVGEITVTVNGNVANAAGRDMGGNCKLIINGNADRSLGVYATSGEIHVNGRIEGLSANICTATQIHQDLSCKHKRCGVTIYQNGKLLVDNGHLVGVLNE
jgi:hypothetical protein